MKKYWRWTSLAVVVLVVGIAVFTYLTTGREPNKPFAVFTAAVSISPDSALVWIAEREGFFRDAGLDLTIIPFTSGKASLEAVLQGEAQFATVADTPVTLHVLRGEQLEVITEITSSDRKLGMIARRDRGIINPLDLRGKTVGAPLGTNAEYFLHAFLTVEGVEPEEVTVVGMPPEATVDALLDGMVDAVAVWQPFLLVLEERLGDEAVSFHGEHVYTHTFNIVGQRDFVDANPLAVKAFLRALLKAESLNQEQPDRAREAVAEITPWDKDVLDALWDSYSFQVGLDQSLLINMENQARWAIEKGLVPRGDVPNFLNNIHFDGLSEVAPRRVTIVR